MGPKATIKNGTGTVDDWGTVYIADGTYKEHITISKNLNIIGQSKTGTIIDGTHNGRPLTITSGLTVNLTNIAIVNGKVTDWAAEGGGIHNRGTLTMTNCSIENNIANGYAEDHVHSWGGGICNMGILTMTNCNVKNNTATATCSQYGAEDANAEGGGVYNSGTLTMTNCNIEKNTAFSGWGKYVAVGGGISNKGTAHIIGCTIINNIANSTNSYITITGGGINNYNGGTLTANFNRIFNNTPNAIASWWGGTINSIEDNWWGSNDPDFGNLLAEATPPTNWLYMGINATPSTISNTETSLITASFNNRYDGTTITPYIPGVGEYIPDGTPVTFSLTNGPFGTLTAPLTVNTLGGIVSILFTATNAGVQDVNGTLDNQKVATSITILAAHMDLNTFYADYNEFVNNNHNIVMITDPVNYLDHVIVVFTAINMGPNPVTDLVLREDWPSKLIGTGDVWHTFDGVNWIQESYLAQGSFNVYPTYAGPLNIGDTCVVVFGAIVNASNTIITNTISTIEQSPNDYEGFDTASADLEVNQFANVTLNKTVDKKRPNVGERVVFTIVATNNGPNTANNLVVTDTLAEGLDFVSCTGNGVWNPITRTITWPAAVVLNDNKITYYLTALVNSSSLAGTNITNIANETHTENPNNSTANCTVYVPKSDLYIKITTDNNNPKLGERFTVTYKLGNRGPDDAENVTITIPIPDGFHILKIYGNGNWTQNGNTITWTFNRVKVGDPYIYLYGYTSKTGNIPFSASISSNTYSINSTGVNSLTLQAIPQETPKTNAANTVRMQNTGMPLSGIVIAILMVMGGLISTRKKQ